MFQTGLVSISFRSLTVDAIMDLCAQCGLKFVEWGSDVHAPCNDKERLTYLAAEQKRRGLTCSSYGTYFRVGITPVEEIYGYIAAAGILGTNIIRLWCGKGNYEDFTEEAKAILLRDAKALAKIAEEEGVYFCMECHPNTFTNCLAGAMELIETVNSKHFGMYWQPNQYISFEENMEYAKTIAPYVTQIHVFNWKEKDRYPLADAVDTWRSYLSCFEGDHALLLEFMPNHLPEELAAEAEALRLILSGM
ncbi:MAG: TIM barrel protein [Clostridia bacterium]|nr:TIM barrel protein [Clostridia bacterium]